ncbi:unnamed protein product, partial [marine sediment metagenome]
MVRERYTMKTVKGGRVKIKQGYLYGVGAPYGFHMAFQEHPPGGSGRTHTHVWIDSETYPDLIGELYSYVMCEFESYPRNVETFALVQAWNVSEDGTEFEGPDLAYELVINRKLSQTHVTHLEEWLTDVLDEFIP